MSNMQRFKIDYGFLKGQAAEYYNQTGEVHSSSYAMLWCMVATRFSRIFTKEDMKEFLFRLAITLHSLELTENWLLRDRLMNYSVKDTQYIFGLDDIIMNFGLEIHDTIENYSERERYLENIAESIKSAMLLGVFENISVIAPRDLGEDIKEISGKRHTPAITPELIAKAEFFANDLMKFIPDSVFTERSSEIPKKEKELADRQERKRRLPVFDIKKIPADIVKQCLEIMYKPEFVTQLLAEPEDFETFARPMIKLAWLWANDFMETDGVMAYEKEGFSLDYNDYKLEDGGFNLLVTIQNYNLDETIPLLKGLLI